MPLLLLLFAILTALTGAVAGVRPVDSQIARPARARDVAHVVVKIVPAVPGHLHLIGAMGPVKAFAVAGRVQLAVVAAPRLYLDRFRA